MNTCATAAGGVGVLLAGVLKKGWGLEAVFAGSAAIFVVAGSGLFIGYRFFMANDLERARAFAVAAQPR